MRTPTVLQAQGNECGIAALAIILGYHGRHVTLDELRDASGISREGVTAARLLALAREYGLEAKGYRKEIAQLRELTLPVIAAFRFNHFVVIEEVYDDRIVVNDPDGGPHAIPIEFVSEDYTGVILTFRPSRAFARSGRPFRTAPALARLLRPFTAEIAAIAFASIVEWGGPLFLALGVRSLLEGRAAVRAIALSAAISGGMAFLSNAVGARLRSRLSQEGPQEMLNRVLKFPPAHFIYRYAFTVCTPVFIWPTAAALAGNSLAAYLAALPIPAAIAMAAVWSPRIAILAGFCCAATLLHWWALCGPRGGAYRTAMREGDGAPSLGATAVREIERLKLGNGPAGAFSRVAGRQAVLLSARYALDVRASVQGALRTALVLLPAAAALADPTPANAAAAVLAVYSVIRFDRACSSWLLSAAFESTLICINDTPRIAEAHRDRAKSAHAATSRGVTFGYDKKKQPLLSGINFEIAPGRVVGLAGRPGSGRSTLARLLCGVLTPWEGTIDAPAAELVEAWNAFFEGSVHDNIALFDPAIGEAEVTEALSTACAGDLIARRGGLGSLVAPDACNLSGGERQRLAIARALVRRPSLLILDEATDAIDPDLERRLMANVRATGAACILITLRPSSLALCDEVLVLENGAVYA